MLSRFVFFLKVSLLGILFLIGKTVISCRILPDDFCEEAFKRLSNTHHAKMKKKNYWHTLFGWRMYKSTVHSLCQDLHKTARQEKEAPDPVIFTMDGVERRLLSQHSTTRPLVLVFGSCTCPPFMASLTQLGKVESVFRDIADFVLVYIDEAHADDEWKFKENYKVTQHKTLQERCHAAQIVKSHKPKGITMFIDSMSNTANKAYGAHPERLYIVNRGKVAYEGGIGPFYYNVQEVHQWLDRFRGEQQPMQLNRVFQMSY